jgi:hypothetical protein
MNILSQDQIEDVWKTIREHIIMKSADLSNYNTTLNYPIITIDNTPYTRTDDDGPIFDILGYFRSDQPDCVTLCEDKIKQSSARRDIDKEILTLIVYIHESAHFLHYHTRINFVSDFNKLSTYFVESFAQLITHKVCIELDAKYPTLLNTFLGLVQSQPIQYRMYGLPSFKEVWTGFDQQNMRFTKDVSYEGSKIIYRYSLDIIINTFIKDSNTSYASQHPTQFMYSVHKSLLTKTREIARTLGLDNDEMTLEMLDVWESEENFHYNQEGTSFIYP